MRLTSCGSILLVIRIRAGISYIESRVLRGIRSLDAQICRFATKAGEKCGLSLTTAQLGILDTILVEHYFRAMRNITITVDEEVARWARVWAARHDTSVSRLVGRVLHTLMQQERGYDAAMSQFFERSPVSFQHEGAYPSRNELHER